MTALILAALAIAVLELDGAEAGQFMISRPIILGPLMGLAFHKLDFGAGIGALCEMFSVEAMPVGACIPPNATVCAGAALLLSLGAGGAPLAAAFPAGLSLGWAYARIEASVRRRRAALCAAVEERLARGGEPAWGPTIFRSLTEHWVVTAAFLLLAVCLVRPALCWGWNRSPEMLREGLGVGFKCAPWLGAGSLARTLWPR